jgi:hypothetical protein
MEFAETGLLYRDYFAGRIGTWSLPKTTEGHPKVPATLDFHLT